MIAIEQLLRSGLPIDWTTVAMAWQANREKPAAIPYVTSEELVDYAMDQIGSVPSEQDSVVAELAFADERDTGTIQRCLAGLASDAPEDVQRARNVWRWIVLDEIVTRLQREALRVPDEAAPGYGVWHDDYLTSVFCDLSDFWREFEPLSQDLNALRAKVGVNLVGVLEMDHVRETLAVYREWLQEKRVELISDVGLRDAAHHELNNEDTN